MTPALPRGCIVGIWAAAPDAAGALAGALALRLQARGIDALHLRPEPADATASVDPRARQHARRIEAAAAARLAVVVAEGSALSLLALADGAATQGLPAWAVAHQRRHALTLLMARPGTPGDVARLREALLQTQAPFAVLHGAGREALAQAWDALQAATDPEARARARETGAPLAEAFGSCEKCSDPSCEHRLFTDLLAARR